MLQVLLTFVFVILNILIETPELQSKENYESYKKLKLTLTNNSNFICILKDISRKINHDLTTQFYNFF